MHVGQTENFGCGQSNEADPFEPDDGFTDARRGSLGGTPMGATHQLAGLILRGAAGP